MGLFDLNMGGGAGTDFVGNFGDGATAATGAGGGLDGALNPEAMAKILGLFSGNETNRIALMNAQKPTFGSAAPNPGHASASQVGKPVTTNVGSQQVVPSLAQILGIKG